jgi:bacterioferritin
MLISKAGGGTNRGGSRSAAGNSKPRWCANQKPYPEVKVEKPNLYYARLLMDDTAGLVSELSATTQYLYHHYILAEKYPEVADLLECISIVEMTHLELLQETIVKLGGQPKWGVKTTRGMDWWRGDLVYYGYDICDMLSADIESEKSAIVQYRKHIDMIDDEYIKALLSRIILDEQHHLEAFTTQKLKYCKK